MRRLALSVALLLATPLLAGAQETAPAERPRLQIAPYTGVRTPFGGGLFNVFLPSGGVTIEEARGGSALVGAEAKLRLHGRFSLVGGAAYSQAGNLEMTFTATDSLVWQGPDLISDSDDPMWMGKLALSARFEAPRELGDTRRRPATEIFAGPGVVREFEEFHPALNFGFEGSLPLVRGVDFTLALEDHLVFWDDSKLSPTLGGVISDFTGEPVQQVDILFTNSNIFQLRMGVSLHAW